LINYLLLLLNRGGDVNVNASEDKAMNAKNHYCITREHVGYFLFPVLIGNITVLNIPRG